MRVLASIRYYALPVSRFKRSTKNPFAFYPLTLLIVSGFREFDLISNSSSLPAFKNAPGSDDHLRISLDYREQAKPEGIAQAFLIAADFFSIDNTKPMLGDNILSGGDYSPRVLPPCQNGATIFAYYVKDSQRYSAVQFTLQGKLPSLEEKRENPKSNVAVRTAYINDRPMFNIARSIKPSAPDKNKVTDVCFEYLRRNQLNVDLLCRGSARINAGTSTAPQEASAHIEAIERRQHAKTGRLKEGFLLFRFITFGQFQTVMRAMPNCEYRDYLTFVAKETEKRLI